MIYFQRDRALKTRYMFSVYLYENVLDFLFCTKILLFGRMIVNPVNCEAGYSSSNYCIFLNACYSIDLEVIC